MILLKICKSVCCWKAIITAFVIPFWAVGTGGHMPDGCTVEKIKAKCGVHGSIIDNNTCYKDCDGSGSYNLTYDKKVECSGVFNETAEDAIRKTDCTACNTGKGQLLHTSTNPNEGDYCYLDCDSGDLKVTSTNNDEDEHCVSGCSGNQVLNGGVCYKDCNGSGDYTANVDVPAGDACTECDPTQVLHNGVCYKDCDRNESYDSTIDKALGSACACGAGQIYVGSSCFKDCDGTGNRTAPDVPAADPCTKCDPTTQVLHNGVCYRDCNRDRIYTQSPGTNYNVDVPLSQRCACGAGQIKHNDNNNNTCYRDCDLNGHFDTALVMDKPIGIPCDNCDRDNTNRINLGLRPLVENNGTCYKDCNGDGVYQTSDAALSASCPLVCNTGEVNDGTSCYKDCDGNSAYTANVDITPVTAACTACGNSQVLHNGACYKDCNTTGSYEAGTDVALTGSCPTIPTCNVAGAYFDRNKNSSECVLDCLDSTGNTHSVQESLKTTSCYFKCPNNAYVLETAQNTCQKTCGDGSTVNINTSCPTSNILSGDDIPSIPSTAPDIPGFNVSNRAVNIHGELAFRSIYSIGRADRPNYICRQLDSSGNVIENIMYTQYFCPLLQDCPAGTVCACQKSNGETVPDTVCDYALIDPLRNERGSLRKDVTTTNRQHVEEVNFEVVTITVPPH